jgi:superfamily II DNA or RNA helicase
MHARYRIGLSGTMKRKDGKHIMFADYFGNKVFVPPQNNTVNPTVKLLRTGVSLTPGAVWAKKINNLLYDPDYQEYVAIIAKTQAAMGHKVLVVADRTEFLQNIKDIIGEKCVLAIGETSLEERNGIESKLESGKASIVAGSRQIFSEGISVNILSCLILATPISNEALLEQLAGRIMRRHPNKLDPIIIDLQFSGPADKKQNNVRLGLYMDKGWEVVSI